LQYNEKYNTDRKEKFMKYDSKTLKELRTEKGKTQDVVADAIDVTRAYYGMIENGVRKPSFENIKKIAEYFDVTLIEIAQIMKNDKSKK
jgi:transcriptional regulator with XRE-family HTH domain